MKRRVRELELELDFLKKAAAYCAKNRGKVYAWLDKNAVPGLSMRAMCRLLGVRRQGYYEHHKRGETQRQYRERLRAQQVLNVFYENRRIYGVRRIAAELNQKGLCVEQASKAVGEYLLYDNRKRLHSSLGYQSPIDFELSSPACPVAS